MKDNCTVEFSIIIPMYNAEKTIRRCLNSIQNQIFTNFEAIIIDDGSKDSSIEICNEYIKVDKRFVLISQTNAGPSIARNRGLDYAKGKYIVFVDSDDWIEKKHLQLLYDSFIKENADVIFMGYHLYVDDKYSKTIVPNISRSNKYEIAYELLNKDMFGYTWIKAFSKKTIIDIRFNENVNLFEDEIFICDALNNDVIIKVLDEALYNYCVGSNEALTKRVHEDYCLKRELVFLAWKKFLNNYINSDDILMGIANTAVKTAIYYGIEKDLEYRMYFKNMIQCDFFKYCKSSSIDDSYVKEMYDLIKEKKINAIGAKRRVYRLKTLLHNKIRG